MNTLSQKSLNLRLGYHQISDKKTLVLNDSTPSYFRQRLVGLRDAGYHFLNCGQVVNLVKEGKSLPKPYAVLSFDDGFKEHYTTVFPILKEVGVTATFFYTACLLRGELPPVHGFEILINQLGVEKVSEEVLPKVLANTSYLDFKNQKIYDIYSRYNQKIHTSSQLRRIKIIFNHFLPHAFKRDKISELFSAYCGEESQKEYIKKYFMSAEELQKMQDDGMEIASHSFSHPFFNTLSHKEVTEEVRASQEIITNAIGQKVKTFAWPFGGIYQDDIKQIVSGTYESAWNIRKDMKFALKQPFVDLYDIQRLNGLYFK